MSKGQVDSKKGIGLHYWQIAKAKGEPKILQAGRYHGQIFLLEDALQHLLEKESHFVTYD